VSSRVWTKASAAQGAADADGACANMRASTATARDQRGFDRSGLLTVRCRHALLLAAADVSGGEKFSYALAAVAQLRALALPIVRVWYDVGDGRLDAAMRQYPQLAGVRPLLPELHARMHAASCQVLWAGTTVAGAGLPNSELSEQENRRLGLVPRRLPSRAGVPAPPVR
jgi:Kyakuja-Dileera-Zisupton transposase